MSRIIGYQYRGPRRPPAASPTQTTCDATSAGKARPANPRLCVFSSPQSAAGLFRVSRLTSPGPPPSAKPLRCGSQKKFCLLGDHFPQTLVVAHPRKHFRSYHFRSWFHFRLTHFVIINSKLGSCFFPLVCIGISLLGGGLHNPGGCPSATLPPSPFCPLE